MARPRMLGIEKPVVNQAGQLHDVCQRVVDALAKYPRNYPGLLRWERSSKLLYIDRLQYGEPWLYNATGARLAVRLSQLIEFRLNEYDQWPRTEVVEYIRSHAPNFDPPIPAVKQFWHIESDYHPGENHDIVPGYDPKRQVWWYSTETIARREPVYPAPTADPNGD